MPVAIDNENKRRRKREKENHLKEIRRKNERVEKSAERCLRAFDYTGIGTVDFSKITIKVKREEINELAFESLTPKLHKNGLKLLLRNGIFDQDAILHDIIVSKVAELNDREKETARKTKEKKEELKSKDAKIQKLLSPCSKSKTSSKQKQVSVYETKTKQKTLFDAFPRTGGDINNVMDEYLGLDNSAACHFIKHCQTLP